jgi:hypothetical protein
MQRPLFALALLALLLAPLILRIAGVSLQSLRQRGSQSWPWSSRGRSRVYQLTVGYSYSVNGETYGGAYTECFGSEAEAQGVLKSLRELPPPARYKPGDPSESVMDPYRDAALGLQDG